MCVHTHIVWPWTWTYRVRLSFQRLVKCQMTVLGSHSSGASGSAGVGVGGMKHLQAPSETGNQPSSPTISAPRTVGLCGQPSQDKLLNLQCWPRTPFTAPWLWRSSGRKTCYIFIIFFLPSCSNTTAILNPWLLWKESFRGFGRQQHRQQNLLCACDLGHSLTLALRSEGRGARSDSSLPRGHPA